MSSVTWGKNDTRLFSSNTPPGSTTPAPLFGSTAAPAAGGAFSTPTLGSSQAPAPPPFGSLSGAAPAPAPTGSLFGGGTPAPSTGLFGSTPAPSTGGFGFGASAAPAAPAPGAFGTTPAPATGGFGLFGAPAPSTSTFGAPASSMPAFGAPATSNLFGAAPTQQQQIPAQAALQAHMDASARQEEARVKAKIEQLLAAYASAPPRDSNVTAPFVSIAYDPISSEQLQRQWLHHMASRGNALVPPPKPDHVSEKDWVTAVVQNPDPENYMPVAVLGADFLRLRVAEQQQKATSLGKALKIINDSHESLQTRAQHSQAYTQNMTRTHAALRKRLLDVMRKVEVVRCMNHPLQSEEVQAAQRLSDLLRQMDKISSVLAEVQDKARSQQHMTVPSHIPLQDRASLLEDLKSQREGIEAATKVVQRDMRDIRLLQQRVVQKVPALNVVSFNTRTAGL